MLALLKIMISKDHFSWALTAKAKDISLQAPRGPRHQRREWRAVAAAHGGHTRKIHARAAELHCKCKADNLLGFYCIAQLIFSHSGEKKQRPFWIFPLKSANGEPRALTFRAEADHSPAPALLKRRCLQGLLHTNRTLWPVCKFMFWPFS